jgi:hypothetical protein
MGVTLRLSKRRRSDHRRAHTHIRPLVVSLDVSKEKRELRGPGWPPIVEPEAELEKLRRDADRLAYWLDAVNRALDLKKTPRVYRNRPSLDTAMMRSGWHGDTGGHRREAV